jgi:hypothetical protein
MGIKLLPRGPLEWHQPLPNVKKIYQEIQKILWGTILLRIDLRDKIFASAIANYANNTLIIWQLLLRKVKLNRLEHNIYCI